MKALIFIPGVIAAGFMFAFAYNTWKNQGEADDPLHRGEPQFFSRQTSPGMFWSSFLSDILAGAVILTASIVSLLSK